MSRLPLEDRNVWGVPGPDYKPRIVCAHPFCHNEDWGRLQIHHLWPRSFLRHQPTTWVKLPDGTQIGNLVYLCREHHQQITENKARIVWDEYFRWDGGEGGSQGYLPLDPQPPRAVDDFPEDGVKHIDQTGTWQKDPPGHIHVEEGTECPTCNRRVPKKRKPTTPTSKVHSFRGPLDEADVIEETFIAAAKHMGVYKKGFWKHQVALMGLVVLLQGPGEE